ncbi:MAG: hypothetical protein JXQ79_05605 [Rhodobacteraceae bacterium]|nr:hypothetical protein [Paracoccaceae bacterium]
MLKSFILREDGAVTVDWVVLSAAIVGLGVSSVAAVRTGVGDLGTDIGNSLSNASIASLGGEVVGFDGMQGCAGGAAAIQDYAQAQAEAGNWDVAGEGPNYGAFDPSDVAGEISSGFSNMTEAQAQNLLATYASQHEERGDEFHASDYVEWAIAECVAAGNTG